MDEEGEVLPEILTHIADKLVEDHQLEDIDTGIFKWALQLRHRYSNYISLVPCSEAIGSFGCRCNSSSGFVLIKQLTEMQLLTCSGTLGSAGIPLQ